MILKNATSSSPCLAVIIPIYKVEPYLHQCLDSVCSQSYTNLKIILVDDGSPDGCGAICDEYAARDPRIHVLHQANRGLSGARNSGLTLVGDCPYVTYLDSDDWLEAGIYQACIARLEADPELDLVQFGFKAIGSEGIQIQATNEILLTSREQVCAQFIQGMRDALTPSVWNKVYRSSLIAGITFREGYNWEDIVYTMEVLYRTKKAQLLSNIGYNYRLGREGAITENVYTQDVSSLFDNLEYLIERYAEDATFVGYANALLVNQLWHYWSRLLPYRKRYRELTPRYRAFIQRARQRPLPNVFRKPKDYRKRRLFLRCPKTYMGIRAWLRRLHSKHPS